MPVAQAVSSSAIICASVWLLWRSKALGSGAGRTSSFAERPRLFLGLALATSVLSFFAMDSRASIAVGHG